MSALSPKSVPVTLFDLAQRFVGVKEAAGAHANPAVLAMLQLDTQWPDDDSVSWCSAFVNYCAWLLRLPRSKSLAARSWLAVGRPVSLDDVLIGFDVAILSRGDGPQPGPDVLNAPGHVGIVAGVDATTVHLLGGNQGDSVNITSFPRSRVLGVRRLLD